MRRDIECAFTVKAKEQFKWTMEPWNGYKRVKLVESGIWLHFPPVLRSYWIIFYWSWCIYYEHSMLKQHRRVSVGGKTKRKRNWSGRVKTLRKSHQIKSWRMKSKFKAVERLDCDKTDTRGGEGEREGRKKVSSFLPLLIVLFICSSIRFSAF